MQQMNQWLLAVFPDIRHADHAGPVVGPGHLQPPHLLPLQAAGVEPEHGVATLGPAASIAACSITLVTAPLLSTTCHLSQ